jgi:hypothetical protein
LVADHLTIVAVGFPREPVFRKLARVEVRNIAMKRLCNVRNWNGLAALACLLLIPGFAKAACLNVNPSFTFTPVVTSGSQSTIEVSAPAGCFWEVVSHPTWMKILSMNRGFGSGSLVFLVLPDKNGMLSPGVLRLVVHDLDTRQKGTVDLSIRETPVSIGGRSVER